MMGRCAMRHSLGHGEQMHHSLGHGEQMHHSLGHGGQMHHSLGHGGAGPWWGWETVAGRHCNANSGSDAE